MPTLRIVQLNVGSLLDPGWKDRRYEVVAWLDRLQPDVICLEEVWESESTQNTADWVAGQAQGTWHRVFGGHHFGEGLWPDPTVRYGSAILSQWPIDNHHVFRLPVLDEPVPREQAAAGSP